MTPQASRQDERALHQVNRQLAELLDAPELPLSSGGGKALEDALWVWGIVGGKDVGKSTLINALAGGEVVDRGEAVGEGTYAPTAYLAASDLAAARARFAGLAAVDVQYADRAPEGMHGLVLVDLPDFDSLFADHLAKVRQIAGALDGIIWVTTPKKVGDLRGIAEIDRILKARANFAYVVNKMDWLIAQSDRPPREELVRAAAALRKQVASCDVDDGRTRSFFVAARYRTRAALIAAIADRRSADAVQANGALAAVVDALLADFDALRTRLTTAPSPEVQGANKRANLAYQLRTQATRMRAHYQVDAVRARVDRALAPEEMDELAQRYFPETYGAAVLRRLNSADALFGAWSAMLFKRRIARWPLLGVIAWPAMALGAALGGLKAMLPRSAVTAAADPFRQDGVGVEERADGLLAGLRARFAGAVALLVDTLPAAGEVVQQFRADAHQLADEQRHAVIASRLAVRTNWVSRCVRGLVTAGIVLWFPLVQPLLEAWLSTATDGVFSLATLKVLTQALSGSTVLSGLCVALLLLALLAGAVYSRAVGDTYRALDRLRKLSEDSGGGPLCAAVMGGATRPAEEFRNRLAEIADGLERFAATGAAPADGMPCDGGDSP